ncbi:MAG: hypothetical protein IJ783_03695 [Kiritimatiellae bacterium]|nr:hypothetical protein [Kiritimatiellia bacterium]
MQEKEIPAAPARKPAMPVSTSTILGLLLIVAALALYVRETKANRTRETGLAVVKAVSAAPVMGMGLRAAPSAPSSNDPIYEPCSPEVGSNVLARLGQALPARRGARPDSKAYDVFLFLADRSRVYLKARRVPGSDDVYVSMLKSRDGAFPAAGAPEFAPALVHGLAGLLDEIDSGSLSTIRKARKLPVPDSYAMLAREAGDHGFDEASMADPAAGLAVLAAAELDGIAIAAQADEGRKPPTVVLPGAALSELQAAFAKAKTLPMPDRAIEGDDYVMFVLFPDRTRLALRIAVPSGEGSADAMIGFVDQSVDPESGETRTVVTAPALVPGIGPAIARVAGLAEGAAAAGEGSGALVGAGVPAAGN